MRSKVEGKVEDPAEGESIEGPEQEFGFRSCLLRPELGLGPPDRIGKAFDPTFVVAEETLSGSGVDRAIADGDLDVDASERWLLGEERDVGLDEIVHGIEALSPWIGVDGLDCLPADPEDDFLL